MTIHNATVVGSTRPTEGCCGGINCQDRAKLGGSRRRKAAGAQLCVPCASRFGADLVSLPGLYAECGQVLGGSDRPREKTSGSVLPGLPFNTSAADARSVILSLLASWSAMVADERRVTAPRRDVADLAAFLSVHADWLVRHAAAGDASQEVAKAARRAYWAAFGEPSSQVNVGRCVKTGCRGELATVLRRRPEARPAEIICSADPDHRWAGDEWLQLSRQLAGGGENAPGGREQWLTAAAIAQLLRIAPGSVYRLASEHRWRRLSRSGRTYYLASDVKESRQRGAR